MQFEHKQQHLCDSFLDFNIFPHSQGQKLVVRLELAERTDFI